jgi:hypothetical protein
MEQKTEIDPFGTVFARLARLVNGNACRAAGMPFNCSDFRSFARDTRGYDGFVTQQVPKAPVMQGWGADFGDGSPWQDVDTISA